MLRIYVIQNLYNLADMAAKYEIMDNRAFSDFCGVDSSNQVWKGFIDCGWGFINLPNRFSIWPRW